MKKVSRHRLGKLSLGWMSRSPLYSGYWSVRMGLDVHEGGNST